MYEILRKLKFHSMNTNEIKYLTHAGGKLDASLHKYLIQTHYNKKINFTTMYGQTEATARISYLPWKKK